MLAAGHPELPYVPGCEAVAGTDDGRTVSIFGGSLGRKSDGAMAERALVGDAHVIEVPEGADPALAARLESRDWQAAAAPNATIVNLGQSAGPTSALASEAVRFKSLAVLGFSVYTVAFDVLQEHYPRLVERAVAGDIRLEVERVPLDAVTEAWRRQVEGAGAKLVVVP